MFFVHLDDFEFDTGQKGQEWEAFIRYMSRKMVWFWKFSMIHLGRAFGVNDLYSDSVTKYFQSHPTYFVIGDILNIRRAVT